MSSETQFHVHHDAPEVIGRRERLGVRLLIVADGAFLFGMLFTFFYRELQYLWKLFQFLQDDRFSLTQQLWWDSPALLGFPYLSGLTTCIYLDGCRC